MKYPLLPLPFEFLLSAALGSVAAWAQVDATPPISGVVGKLKEVTNTSVEIQTKTGVVRIEIKQPLTIYREVPSDLSHVTSSTYVGVTSVKQANGMEPAKHIMIFPTELRGAAEGSFMMNADATTHSRMTNGSVVRPAASNSRMTNGTVRKGGGATLLVHYQDGAQTISVPPQCSGDGSCTGKDDPDPGRHNIRCDNRAAQRAAHDGQDSFHRLGLPAPRSSVESACAHFMPLDNELIATRKQSMPE